MSQTAPATEIERTGVARHTPLATYRLQFNRGFTFDDARRLLPYLHDLGVTDVYASPYLKASPSSSHGYDIVDHNALNPEIGDALAYERFVAELHALGMHQILDVVPNHMGILSGNGWWLDVLENGPASPFAAFFDIDWQPPASEMANRVLLPILGDQFGKVLENGELRLEFADGRFRLRYYDHLLPIAPDTYGFILQPALDLLADTLNAADLNRMELESILRATANLPGRTETAPERTAARQQERLVIQRRLQALAAASPDVRDAIDRTLEALNGRPNDPDSFDLLAELLDQQAYRLSYWRVAADEINYRRFFDVNGLAALRMDRPAVLAATHGLILRLVAEGKVSGLRIDHPDGLRDPEGYLRWLQAQAAALTSDVATPESQLSDGRAALRPPYGEEPPTDGVPRPGDTAMLAADEDAGARSEKPLYVVVEKILGHGEQLPAGWPVDGTTGYGFLNQVNGLFVDGANRRELDRLYRTFTGNTSGFRDLAYAAKKEIMRSVLASEVNVLGLQLRRVAAHSRRYRDFSLNALTAALVEVIANFPVYRTYIRPGERPGDTEVAERDRYYIDFAIERAKRLSPTTDPSIYDFLRATLLLSEAPTAAAETALVDFVLKFQQVSAPVMAKGVEDTAFYRYTRLVSLNEVGGDPEQFGVPVSAFHRQNADRLSRWPHALLATATHDTKRGEDVRARIDVLSELPADWAKAVRRWARLNGRHRTSLRGRLAPDRKDEYLLYQTLVGAWPFELLETLDPLALAAFRDRIWAYMEKAVREAKTHTSWINQNAPYEEALRSFVAGVLSPGPGNLFLRDAVPFIRTIAARGVHNSLAQTLLKLTCPGVPDVYQGAELWDLSLVDPDNRRPVDFVLRNRLLAGLGDGDGDAALAAELLAAPADGRIKLFLTRGALGFRQRRRDLFGPAGAYVPVDAAGDRAEHVVAFMRRVAPSQAVALVAVPRLTARFAKNGEPPTGKLWGDTNLVVRGQAPGARFRDVFTGATLTTEERDGATVLPLAGVFASLPFALAERLSDASQIGNGRGARVDRL